MLHNETIETGTMQMLKELQKMPFLKDTRLVGGTALALQYGHRRSVDLDFFGYMDCEDEDIIDSIRPLGKIKIISMKPNIKVLIINNVKVDFVNYKYKWIDNPVKEADIVLASPKDIAAMKVNAIEGRGTKKDFIDLYYLLKYYKLSDIIGFYENKYPENSAFRAILSMGYFDDADPQPMPFMYEDISWNSIKESIIKTLASYNSTI